MARYDLQNTTLGTLLDDPDVRAIIDEHAPGLTSNPMIAMAKGLPATQVLDMAGPMLDHAALERIRSQISTLG